MIVLRLGTVHQLRSHYSLVQQNNCFSCQAVNIYRMKSAPSAISSTHMQFVSHGDLGPLLLYCCSSSYFPFCICSLQGSSIDITIPGICLYWISPSWLKQLLEFSRMIMNSDPFLQNTFKSSQPVNWELLYICFIPPSKTQTKWLTRTGIKADLRGVLYKKTS